MRPTMQSRASSAAAHGSAEHLVKMANDIGNFFRSEPVRTEGVAGVANHIAKFWTPRMRQKLLDHIEQHGEAESADLPPEALKLPATPSTAARPREPAGGDAG